MISSIEYLLNKNLFESSAAADNAVANSGFYYYIFFFFFFTVVLFFSSEKWGEKKGRRGCVLGGLPRRSGRIFAEAPQMMRYYLL